MKLSVIYIKDFSEKYESKKKFKESTKKLIRNILDQESKNLKSVNIVFCDDVLMRKYNKRYLKHDYETDIITFYNADNAGMIEGELLISEETVRSNSKRFRTLFEKELNRVIIHGILHLCGYDDRNTSQKKIMKSKENHYLNQI